MKLFEVSAYENNSRKNKAFMRAAILADNTDEAKEKFREDLTAHGYNCDILYFIAHEVSNGILPMFQR